MKRLITLLMASVLCLSLTACNKSDSNNTPLSTNSIETESSEPQFTAVALTIENWNTYFEVVQLPQFSENAFGEIDKFDLEYNIQLKEQYYSLLNVEKTNIAMEISYNYGERICTVDFENQTYKLGDRLRTESTTVITDKFNDFNGRYYCSPFGVTFYDNGSVRYYEDVQMLRISGTLYLKAE